MYNYVAACLAFPFVVQTRLHGPDTVAFPVLSPKKRAASGFRCSLLCLFMRRFVKPSLLKDVDRARDRAREAKAGRRSGNEGLPSGCFACG